MFGWNSRISRISRRSSWNITLGAVRLRKWNVRPTIPTARSESICRSIKIMAALCSGCGDTQSTRKAALSRRLPVESTRTHDTCHRGRGSIAIRHGYPGERVFQTRAVPRIRTWTTPDDGERKRCTVRANCRGKRSAFPARVRDDVVLSAGEGAFGLQAKPTRISKVGILPAFPGPRKTPSAKRQ